jgi:uncharacterized protein YndB with AHSA1/START domain
MTQVTHQPDPQLDLFFERIIDVSPELVWAAWTTPEHLKHWFTPAPWRTIDCEIDLRPGGLFRTVMCSPEGQAFPNIGCYLETNALKPGYRPVDQLATNADDDFPFTAVISLEPHNTGTKYTALVIHRNEEDRKKHEDMGFQDGWGKALDQLIEHMKKK